MKLSADQRKTLSEFLANIGVAWFAGGIIAPFFTIKIFSAMIIPGLWGVVLSMISISFSLMVLKKKTI